jgi:hypothetical protein
VATLSELLGKPTGPKTQYLLDKFPSIRRKFYSSIICVVGGRINLKKHTNNIHNALRHTLIIGAGAFFLAILVSFASQIMLDFITSIIISLVLLLIIILVGIVFDIIGVASAAADEVPLHAKSAKKVNGAMHALLLVRNADKVSSFCNDVVGDICGTLSGAIGAVVVLRIIVHSPGFNEVVANTIMTSLVASLTVAGKAFAKSFAIRNSTEIIFQIGRILAILENYLRIKLINGHDKKGRRR